MSAEAVRSVREHATGTDAQKRLLEVLADWANPRGIAYDIRAEDLAAAMGKTKGGISGVKTGLKESKQLVVIEEGGKGRGDTYLLALPGLSTVEDAEPEPEEVETPKRPDKVKAKVWEEFWTAGYPYFPKEIQVPLDLTDPVQMVAADAMEMLQQKRKVGNPGKLVTPRELALAAVCIITFNKLFEWDGKQGSDYGLGGSLSEVVLRVRDRPSWDAQTWVRLIESAWRVRWWERQGNSQRRPTPSVIWSPKAFEQVVQDAVAEKEGKIKGGRRFTRGS